MPSVQHCSCTVFIQTTAPNTEGWNMILMDCNTLLHPFIYSYLLMICSVIHQLRLNANLTALLLYNRESWICWISVIFRELLLTNFRNHPCKTLDLSSCGWLRTWAIKTELFVEQGDRERGRVSCLQCHVWTCLIRIRQAHKTMQKKRPSAPLDSVTNVNIQPVENITAAGVSGKVSLKAHSLSLTTVETCSTERDLLSPQEL